MKIQESGSHGHNRLTKKWSASETADVGSGRRFGPMAENTLSDGSIVYNPSGFDAEKFLA